MFRFIVVLLIGFLSMYTAMTLAEGPVKMSVEGIYKDMAQLKGKQVQLQGKVVKVNNGIMRRNFLHLQDGSGSQGTNDIVVTSEQTANVGDEVLVTGTVVLDTDFGAGYVYPLLVEKASITQVTH